MLYTEEAVRANIRNREGKRVFFLGKGDTLTPGARDFLSRERVEIRPAETAKIDTYRLLNGGFVTEKPEHMTHLNGDVLVSKSHPRIAFRGAVDTLEAEIILCQLNEEQLKAAGRDPGSGPDADPLRGDGRAGAGGKALRSHGGGDSGPKSSAPGFLRSAPFYAGAQRWSGGAAAESAAVRGAECGVGGGQGFCGRRWKGHQAGHPSGTEPHEQHGIYFDASNEKGK